MSSSARELPTSANGVAAGRQRRFAKFQMPPHSLQFGRRRRKQEVPKMPLNAIKAVMAHAKRAIEGWARRRKRLTSRKIILAGIFATFSTWNMCLPDDPTIFGTFLYEYSLFFFFLLFVHLLPKIKVPAIRGHSCVMMVVVWGYYKA